MITEANNLTDISEGQIRFTAEAQAVLLCGDVRKSAVDTRQTKRRSHHVRQDKEAATRNGTGVLRRLVLRSKNDDAIPLGVTQSLHLQEVKADNKRRSKHHH